MKNILIVFTLLFISAMLFTTCSKDADLTVQNDSPFVLKSANGYVLAKSTEDLYRLVHQNVFQVIGKDTEFDIVEVNFTIRESSTEAEVIYNTKKYNRNIIFYWLHDGTNYNEVNARTTHMPPPVAVRCHGDNNSCQSADMPPTLPIPVCHVKKHIRTGKYRCLCGDADKFTGTDLGCIMTVINGPDTTSIDCTGNCRVAQISTKDVVEPGTGKVITYVVTDTVTMPCVEYYNDSTEEAECRCNDQPGLCNGPSTSTQ